MDLVVRKLGRCSRLSSREGGASCALRGTDTNILIDCPGEAQTVRLRVADEKCRLHQRLRQQYEARSNRAAQTRPSDTSPS